MIPPGQMLGMLGGGQLGRMFAYAAHAMGYAVTVLDPDPRSPAGSVAERHLCAAYDDQAALAELATTCAAVTTEFDNAPAASMDWLAAHCVVRPAGRCVAIAQDRIAEKTFIASLGLAVAPCAFIRDPDDLEHARATIRFPAILKSRRFGYDGKGQVAVPGPGDLEAAYRALGGVACVLEQRVDLTLEVSAIVARAADGAIASWPVAENRHDNGILDVCVVPARAPAEVCRRALEFAERIAVGLEYCGVLAVEFFLTRAGELLVNELAPRPHNSGHFTIDACITSQFEQQVRTLCALPLGDTRLHTPAAMVNLLGDVWAGGEPDWEALLREPGLKLHLYGKHEPRAGRKMGHYTVLAADPDTALAIALAARSALRGRGAAAPRG